MPTNSKITSKQGAKPGAKSAARSGGPGKAPRANTPAQAGSDAATAAEKRAHLRAVDAPDSGAQDLATGQGAVDASQDGAFKRADLIAAVSERTALKRSDAKIVLDLVLEELGRALDGKDDLALPPLGKLSVKKRKPGADGPGLLTVKIRRPRADAKDAGGQGNTPLADPGEDS